MNDTLERRKSAREREAAAPVIDERTVISLDQESLPPAAEQLPGTANTDQSSMTQRRQLSYTLYKKVDYGWKPTIVKAGSVEACLKSGAFRMECGDCGGHCGLDPNSCPGRAKLPFRRCPVCRKAIYDTIDDLSKVEDGELEEGEIRDDTYALSTPEARTKVKLDNHLVAFHPSDAQRMGLLSPQVHTGVDRSVVVAPVIGGK
ncbi:MAG: hypothetical protein AB7E70_20155 [Hyphomicrobiaceae bacterium]